MNRDAMVAFLKSIVDFDTSINPREKQFPPKDCADFIHEHAKKNGYEILSPDNCYYGGNTDYPLYPVLLAKRGKSPGKTILFLGHIDVVPISNAELSDWNSDPFDAKVTGDIMFGRGSGDMKGGVAAFFAAFDDFSPDVGNVIIALSGDEEIGGVDTVPQMIDVLKEKNLLPDYAINAEASSSPFIVTKRGGTQISYEFDLDLAQTTGKSHFKKFYSSLGDGSTGLHSMSFLAGSSIHAMISAAVATQDKPVVSLVSSSAKTNAVPKEVSIDYIEVDPTISEEVTYSKGLTKMMHALASISSLHYPIVPSKYGPSVCPNLIKIDNDTKRVTLTFDIRSMLEDLDSHEKMARLIQDHFKLYDLETEYNLELLIDPVNVDPEHEFAVLADTIARKHGYQPAGRGEKLGGASDTRFFTSLGIPGIEIGPIATNGHGINETVDIQSIIQLQSIFKELYQALQ